MTDNKPIQKPNYYAITPAEVRYNKNLSANAKLLFGEITALCHNSGECWATSKYFADLYEVDTRTIRRWIEALVKYGYIDRRVIRDDNNRVKKRIITLTKQKHFKCIEDIKKFNI